MPYNINFHQTFKPEKMHISDILAIDNLTASKEDISHQFGIPTGKSSGKVEVSLLYAQAAGLLKFTKKQNLFSIERSQLGELVFDNDSFLEHEQTQLLFHYFFCSKNSDLQLWELLFTKYHKATSEVITSEFLDFLQKTLQIDNIKLAPLWGTYISEDPLINLALLEPIEKGKYKFNKVAIIEHYVNWYAFFLCHFLYQIDPTRNEFTIEELLSEGFHNIFSWDSSDLKVVLEIIESKNLINLNKQFQNFHIYINQNFSSLIKKLEYL